MNETYSWTLQSILLTYLIGYFFPYKKMNQYKCVKIIQISSNENHGRALSQLAKFLKHAENGNLSNGF